GNGVFQSAQTYGTGSGAQQIVGAVGDLNGDGKPDVAITRSYSSVAVLLGNGNGTFGPPQTFATGKNVLSVAIGESRADGIPDLLVASTGPNILLGNGDGRFHPAPQSYLASVPAIAALDINNDGRLDFLQTSGVQIVNSALTVALNTATGNFTHGQTYSI